MSGLDGLKWLELEGAELGCMRGGIRGDSGIFGPIAFLSLGMGRFDCFGILDGESQDGEGTG